MNNSDDMLAGAWIPVSTDPDGEGEIVLTDEHFHRPSRTTDRLSAIEAEVGLARQMPGAVETPDESCGSRIHSWLLGH